MNNQAQQITLLIAERDAAAEQLGCFAEAVCEIQARIDALVDNLPVVAAKDDGSEDRLMASL